MAKSKPDKGPIAQPIPSGTRRIESELTGINLAPSQIRAWLLQAETGDIAAQCELFEQMEQRDGELDGHLRTRKNAVASLGHEILAADESSEAEAAAEYARDMMDGITGLRNAIFDLLDAVPKGFAVLEVGWETSASEWRPTTLTWRPQRWFTLGDDGYTLFLKGEKYDEQIPLNPLNFIVHSARARSGFLPNWSLLKSCVRPFVMRQYGVKDWLGFVEVYGMPLRAGYLRDGIPWDSDEAKAFKSALASMGMDMSILLREGNKIEFPSVGVTGEGQVFQSILEFAEKEMTKAVLGQLLTSGGEGGGSYALGQVHNQVRGDLTETDARALDETLTQQLIAPIVRLNKGPNAPCPVWQTALAEPEDLPQLATTIKVLSEAGMPVPISWVREKFNIPEPEGDEPVLKPPARGPGMFSNEISPRSLPAEAGARSLPARAGTEGRGEQQTARELIHDVAFQEEARLWRCTPQALALRLHQAEATPWRILDRLALSFLGEKRIATPDAWKALSPAGKQRAWWVTGLDEGQTARVASELTQVLEAGETENQFLERMENAGLSVPESAEAGAGQMPTWQARLVHRNNRWTAQNAGQYIRVQQDRDVRPYGQWLCHTPCDICAPLCGNVAPLDGGFFATYWPPIHHGCQCEVVSMSADEVGAEGLDAALSQPDPAPLDAPSGFLFHPGDAFYLSSQGGAPTTDEGRGDLALLSSLAHVAELL